MVALDWLHWVILLSALAAACFFDLLTRRVPNWLTVGTFGSGLVARATAGDPLDAAFGLAGAACGLAILIYPFVRRWVKGGDVKLLMATGAWLGPVATLHAALAGSAAGGLLSLVYWLRAPKGRRQEISTNLRLALFLRTVPAEASGDRFAHPPYALALAAGAAAALILHRERFGLV